MTKLQLLLREYEDVRYATDRWNGKLYSARFVFDTETQRSAFIQQLKEINAEYRLETVKKLYKIEVFFDRCYDEITPDADDAEMDKKLK